jgi:hypothetical protein
MSLTKSADQALVYLRQAISFTDQPSPEVLRHPDVVPDAAQGVSLFSQMSLEIL